MAINVTHKRSSQPGKVPTAGQLGAGELAINTADGRLFFLVTDGRVVEVQMRTERGLPGGICTLGPDGRVGADQAPLAANIRENRMRRHFFGQLS